MKQYVLFLLTSVMASFELRSETQCEFLVALSLIEKCRYFAEASQQLSFTVLTHLLPTIKCNLEILTSINLGNFEYDYFYTNVSFSLRACIASHEKLIRVIEMSHDDKSLYDNFCSENTATTLPDLCNVLDSIWFNYWKRFHINENKMSFLHSTEDMLVKLYSHVTLQGNERFPDSYRCLSCEKNTGYLKTGRSNVCDGKDQSSSSANYCYHFIESHDKSKFVNINRTIFERRLNEKGISQQ